MKTFEEKWQKLAGEARKVAPRDESAPFGFAGRVVAHRPPEESGTVELWGRLTFRFLSLMLPVLVVCAALEIPHLRSSPSLESGVQNTVAQILWRL